MDKLDFSSYAEQMAATAMQHPEFGKVNLGYIRGGVAEILKLIGKNGIFDEYTLHDMAHIDAMLKLLDIIIPDSTKNLMTPGDWLLTVLSCYFHDLGMLVTKKEFDEREKSGFPKWRDEVLLNGDTGTDYAESLGGLSNDARERFYYQEFVRHYHAERVHLWVTGRAKDRLGVTHAAVDAVTDLLDGIEDKFREDLGLVCRSHHLDNLDQTRDIYVLRRAYGQAKETWTNVQYAALLLRTADLMQIQECRTPTILFRLIDPGNPKSQEEWVKQNKVRAVLPQKSESDPDKPNDTFEVQASYDEAVGFFGLDSYIQYARGQIAKCWEWSESAKKQGSNHEYPWRYIDDHQVEAKGFLPQRYEFRLDRRKILELLTGHTLYNDSRVAIREILQNSIDAVRLQKVLAPGDTAGQVSVQWHPEERRLVVRDTGTGMTRHIIEEHLLNVGSSYYQDPQFKEKHPEFSPISRFGIGVLSYFMLSNDVTILTVHPDDEVAHEVTLPSATSRYLIKTIDKDDARVAHLGQHGTEVSLLVRRSAELADVAEIVKYWIVIPECPVFVAVGSEEPESVGFKSPKEALEHVMATEAWDRFNASRWECDDVNVNECARDGCDVAYAVEHRRFLRVWDFMIYDSRLDFGLTAMPKNVKEGTGICVHGVRIADQVPGFLEDMTPLVLVDVTGTDAPRTNVARSALERKEDGAAFHKQVYTSLLDHVSTEHRRIIEEGGGLERAARQADWLVGTLSRAAGNRDLVQACADELRIIAIEEQDGRRIVAKTAIDQLDHLWTIDGEQITYVDGLCETLGLNLSSSQIAERLGCETSVGECVPRLIGNSARPLRNLEPTAFLVDHEGGLLRVKWEAKQGRWLSVPKEALQRLRTDIGHYSRSSRGHWENIRIEIGPIECDDASLHSIEVRDELFFLSHSAAAELLRTFGETSTCWEWLSKVMVRGAIPDDDLPRLREQVQSAGRDPEEVIPLLTLPFDRRFRLGYYQR